MEIGNHWKAIDGKGKAFTPNYPTELTVLTAMVANKAFITCEIWYYI
jgi:hypothetical protein